MRALRTHEPLRPAAPVVSNVPDGLTAHTPRTCGTSGTPPLPSLWPVVTTPSSTSPSSDVPLFSNDSSNRPQRSHDLVRWDDGIAWVIANKPSGLTCSSSGGTTELGREPKSTKPRCLAALAAANPQQILRARPGPIEHDGGFSDACPAGNFVGRVCPGPRYRMLLRRGDAEGTGDHGAVGGGDMLYFALGRCRDGLRTAEKGLGGRLQLK